MGVATLLPLADGFVLTVNRDAPLSRPAALPPILHAIGTEKAVFPEDRPAGGSWIVATPRRMAFLLNGAFRVATADPKPRQVAMPLRSRGQVLLDYLQYETPRQFADTYPLTGINPFMMVAVDPVADATSLYELRWNGVQVYSRRLPDRQPFIWSTLDLYTDAAAELRKAWLAGFLYRKPDYTPDDLFTFHQQAGDDDPRHRYVMHRPDAGLATASITQVIHTRQGTTMRYLDVRSGESHSIGVV
ncbi:hypothetical protein GCM10027578_17730 [Spirosoma luteolum]